MSDPSPADPSPAAPAPSAPDRASAAIDAARITADRRIAAGAVGLAVLCVVACVAATWADVATGTVIRPEPLDWAVWSSTVPGAALAIAGAVLAVRLPRHLMTWLLIGGGAVAALNGLAGAYAVLSLTRHDGAWPLTSAAVYAGARLGPLLNLLPLLILLFFPDGRLPSPRWRWAAWLSLGSTGLVVLVFLTVPWRIESADGEWPWLDPPLPPIPDGFWRSALALAPVLLVVSLLVSVAAFAWRFRGSTGVRRAQLRWMLLAALLNMILILAPAVVTELPQDLSFVASLVSLATAVLIAVSRFRLYDIDPVLGWTMLYGGLAVAVIAIDVPVFVGLGALIDEPIAAVLAAVAVGVVYSSRRESGEILALIAAGLSNRMIAERLSLSPKTVRNNVSNVFTKLQVADRAQAIIQARDAGLGR